MNKNRYFIHPDEVKGYQPPKHNGVTNYRLVGKGVLQAEKMEIIMGVLQKGGEAEPHTHFVSEQAIFIIEGRMRAQVGEEIRILEPDSLICIPPNIPHCLTAVSDKVKTLVIYTPPLSDW